MDKIYGGPSTLLYLEPKSEISLIIRLVIAQLRILSLVNNLKIGQPILRWNSYTNAFELYFAVFEEKNTWASL